ncbi:MAG: B12-binding domain-containing radical SAM protein [Chlorobi bacterium]|nr:B12-binding domain-containing radical SAM protein [Chlorobiota bacterium]MCI0716616.1 B12-binding domain-containing radical SAM protein [Chlorobiota bacterium]
MADVLFANSYFLKHDPKEYRAMNLYAPLGTLYAAAYIKSKGYETALFDTMLADSEEDLKAELSRHNPQVMVIYDDVFNYLTKMCLSRMREAAFRMSEIAKEHGCKVIVSGSDSADHIEKYFNRSADYVICGEGEITLGELIGTIARNEVTKQSLTQIYGLAYIENGNIVRTASRKVLKELDTLPYPDWSLIDVERYRQLWLKHHGYFSMNLVTTRGCPFHCNWCAKPIYGQVYNSHSPEYIVNEMKMLKEKYSPDHIWFCDDIFGLKPGWTASFSETVNKENVKVPFKCLSRADLLLKEDNITHLANSGCESVWMGAESGSQKILDAMDKGTTIEQIHESTHLLKKHGIKTCFFLQFGYTEETLEEIKQTIRLVNELMPDDIGISVSYPLPGTKFYERVAAQMKTKQNWEVSDDFEMMFDGEYSTEYYRILHKFVHKQFRSRQLLSEPLKRFKSLWKLPFYLLGWMWYGIKLKRQERTESITRNSNVVIPAKAGI